MPGKKDDDFENIGFVSADYVFSQSAMQNNKTPEKPYYKIHGILLDIREVMIHHAKSNQKNRWIRKSHINLTSRTHNLPTKSGKSSSNSACSSSTKQSLSPLYLSYSYF